MTGIQADRPFVLGIDLGVRSVGFALLEIDQTGKPQRILRSGVRCFEAGVEGDVEKGKDQSRAAARRGPRQTRRQIWRRARRRRKILRILQLHGLMPDGPIDSPQAIHEYITGFDVDLRCRHISNGDAGAHHVLLYRLRAKALDERLDLHDLGRVLYHLAQRRGFLSNRRTSKGDEDEGLVKTAIGELATKITASGARTLGEYFARLDLSVERIRQRWTSRQMYLDEFNAIWSSQQRFHPELSDSLKALVLNAIFHQRPLKSQSHLVGRCELVPGRRRAPMASRIAQRFRLLAAVNNLQLIVPGELNKALTAEQRTALIEMLDREGDCTFAAVRKALKIKDKFNLEEGGEKKLPGNRTGAKLSPIFGKKWASMSDRERDDAVDILLSIDDEGALARLAKRKWGFDEEQAAKISQVRLEQDRSRHCRAALERLVIRMEEGTHYATARKEEFPESFQSTTAVDTLPPVLKAFTELRNPAVCRALTELRKVVNAVIQRYGKPQIIRIELARDLKNPRQKRKDTWEKNRANQKRREDAKARILKEIPNFGEPRASDMEKVLLADECNWNCPFTGKGINMQSLLGRTPEFDVEHIWPFSRTLENGYPNKTLCHVDENRHVKRNRTPFEAYSGNEKRWNEIISRVKAFKSDMARVKLAKFLAETLPEDFTAAQLQDTRYASRLAGDYVSLLYGGRSDAEGTLRVQVSTGQVTAYLRGEWNLNRILNDGGIKDRTNHKHHAVDAIAIALASPATVKMLSDAASNPWAHKRRLFAPVAEPWLGFVDDVRKSIDAINVSHRVNHKLNGALHDRSNYSTPHPTTDRKGKPVEVRHIRKPVTALSANEIESIVDPAIRGCVKERLTEVGNDAKKLENNWPMLPTKDGRQIPIRKARIRKVIGVKGVGSRGTLRFVAPGANHHSVILARKNKKGEAKWEDRPVTLLDAIDRKKHKSAVIQHQWPDAEFVMWLSPGDSMLMENDDGEERLFLVMSISEGDNEFRLHDDARTADDLKKAKARVRGGGDKLRQRKARKVFVTSLGDLIPAND